MIRFYVDRSAMEEIICDGRVIRILFFLESTCLFSLNGKHLPIELCLDVPRKKYTKTGKKAMYMPTIGGTLPNIAYAIPVCVRNID